MHEDEIRDIEIKLPIGLAGELIKHSQYSGATIDEIVSDAITIQLEHLGAACCSGRQS